MRITPTYKSYDRTHSYKAKSGATVVNPGHVFWNEPTQGWSFNVIIDDICVKSRFFYPRHRVAEEAMRLEVDSIRATLAKSLASVTEITEHYDAQ